MAHRDDLSAEKPHPGDIQRLTLRVLRSHVDDALKAQQGGRGRAGNAVLTGAGLGDDARLAHASGQQRLAEHIVDLVRPRVVEVLALEQDAGSSGVLSEIRGLGDDARTAGVGAVQTLELTLESRVDLRLESCLVELLESSHEGLWNVATAIRTEATGRRGRGGSNGLV